MAPWAVQIHPMVEIEMAHQIPVVVVLAEEDGLTSVVLVDRVLLL